MRRIGQLSLRALLLLISSLAIFWLYEEAAQWLLRWHAHRLLASIDLIALGNSADKAESILNAESRFGIVEQGRTSSQDLASFYSVRFVHSLPRFLCANESDAAKNWLPRILDHLGMRNSAVGAGIITRNGVVIQKGFSEEVDLPVHDRFLRGGAFVPSLVVTSTEKSNFNGETDQIFMQSSHPHYYLRRMKGAFGLMVIFTPDEPLQEQTKMMDFRNSCITKFHPCRNEREILEEGENLIESENQ